MALRGVPLSSGALIDFATDFGLEDARERELRVANKKRSEQLELKATYVRSSSEQLAVLNLLWPKA